MKRLFIVVVFCMLLCACEKDDTDCTIVVVQEDTTIIELAEQYQIEGLTVEETAEVLERFNFIDGKVYKGEEIIIPDKEIIDGDY